MIKKKAYKEGTEVNIEFNAIVQQDSGKYIYVNQEGEILSLEINKNYARIKEVEEE